MSCAQDPDSYESSELRSALNQFVRFLQRLHQGDLRGAEWAHWSMLHHRLRRNEKLEPLIKKWAPLLRASDPNDPRDGQFPEHWDDQTRWWWVSHCVVDGLLALHRSKP